MHYEAEFDKLLDAMEHHGNAEGTEAQLGDAEEFLEIALGLMTPEQLNQFYATDEVVELMEREGGSDGAE